MKNRSFILKLIAVFTAVSLGISGCGFSKSPKKKDMEETVEEKEDKKPEKSKAKDTVENPYKDFEHYEDVYVPTDKEIEEDPDEAFIAYTDSLFKADIVLNTINLHYTLAYPENYGIDDYEVNLGMYSPDDHKNKVKYMDLMDEQLERYDKEELNDENKIAYEVLRDFLNEDMKISDLYLYGEPLSGSNGQQAVLPTLLAEYTFRRERDIEDYLELLTQVDEYFDSLIIYEEEKADAGLFMSDDRLDDTIDSCEQFIKDPESNFMIGAFDEKLDKIDWLSDDQKEEYKEENKKRILNDVIPAYEGLIDDLSDFYGKGENDGGICGLPDGKRYYEYLVKANVGSEASVKDIEDRADDYINDRYSRIAKMIYEDESIYDSLMNFSFKKQDPEEIMQDLIRKCQKDFPEPPDVNYEIKSVDPSMEDHTNPAFFLTPPIDDKSENVIYINWSSSDKDTLYTTLAHEGYPGHLYESAFTSNYDRPLIRENFGWGGYTEGWATYTEFYSYGLGIDDTDLANIMMWDRSTTLAIYAYLDMKINYDGWDVNDVASYLEKFYGDNANAAAKEIFAYIVDDPASYLNYFDGYLEFINLRNRAKKALGDDFVLKDFHQFIMDMGPMPFYMLDEHMDEWINDR